MGRMEESKVDDDSAEASGSEDDCDDDGDEEISSEEARRTMRRNNCYLLIVASIVLTLLGVVIGWFVEHWEIETSLYVITQVVTTVGYGDITVDKYLMREFMVLYVLLCLVFFAYGINLCVQGFGEMSLEHFKTFVRSWEQKHAQKLDDIMTHTVEKGAPDEELLTTAGGISQTVEALRSQRVFHLAQTKIDALNDVIGWGLVFLAFVMFGTLFYGLYESCTCSYGATKVEDCREDDCEGTGGYINNPSYAFYMSVITLTTVGFGDHTPKTRLGRTLGIFWMLTGVSCTVKFLETLTRLFFEIENKRHFMVPHINKRLFDKMDSAQKGYLTKADFRSYMLVHHGLIPEDLIDEIDEHFAMLCPESESKPEGAQRLRFSDLQGLNEHLTRRK